MFLSKSHKVRGGFWDTQGRGVSSVATVEFAATDKRQSELNLKPSTVGEGVFICLFLVRTRNRRKKAWGLRPSTPMSRRTLNVRTGGIV